MSTSAPSRPALRALGRRAGALRRRRLRPGLVRRLGLSPRDDLLRLGSDYGGWVIASSLLSQESVCVLAGAGGGTSFALAPFAPSVAPSFCRPSPVNLKGTDAALEAQVRSVDSLMKELGVDRVDLLKVSAEGS